MNTALFPDQLDDYSFEVPTELIAQQALADRDQSRLLCRYADGKVRHKTIKDLPQLLPEGSLVLLNNSRVFPARILGVDQQVGKFEVLLLQCVSSDQNSSCWQALAKPLKKLKEGIQLQLSEGLQATTGPRQQMTDGTPSVQVFLSRNQEQMHAWLERWGHTPLPPYIQRHPDPNKPESQDRQRYQTVYAESTGSVAAPTAGLHITEALMQSLDSHGITLAKVTLHVGAGTFLPVKQRDISQHQMHQENYFVPLETLETIEDHHARGQGVYCVGTTTLRCIESFYRLAKDQQISLQSLSERWHQTSLFIRPQQQKSGARQILRSPLSGMLTNFHQPQSTLFIMICALLGRQNALDLYREAVDHQYRFYSYGDANLLFW